MRVFITIVLAFLGFYANSQLTHGGVPIIDLSNEHKQFEIPEIIIKDFSKEEILKIRSEDTLDYIIGQSIFVNIDFFKESKVIKTDNYVSYLLELSTDKALALNLTFSKFVLPNDAKMYIWSNKSYFGAFTNENMRKDSTFHFASVNSNKLIIEIDIPRNKEKNNFTNIKLEKVGYFFESLFLLDGTEISSGRSGECNNNVNCDKWEDWCNQIRSTVLYAFSFKNGNWSCCSGAMVNNYYQDFTPYLLTAEHCIDDHEEYGNLNFNDTEAHFNYQSPICINQDMSSRSRVVGSEVLASCEKTDVALLILNSKIPEQFNVYFAGYDTREKNDMPSDIVVSIHHPRIDIKKISRGKWNAGILSSHWRVCWTDGIMEPGSSGAPIFEEKTKRIVGVHSMGTESLTCEDEGDFCKWIGKLRYCWHDGGIEKYLGKGIATLNLNGADPILACQKNMELDNDFRDAREYREEKHQIIIQASDSIIIAQNSDVTFITNPSSYSNFFIHTPQPNFLIQAGNRIEITSILGNSTRINIGSIVRFQIQDCVASEEQCGFNYFDKTRIEDNDKIEQLTEEVKNNISKINPNPFRNVLKLEFSLEEKAVISANLYNVQGQLIQPFIKNITFETGVQTLNFDVQEAISLGIYIFEFCINNECERKQLIKE